jgi:signal transduction histidine kinase
MKRRIRSIFLLMTLCILGINLFQGYWLYHAYQLQNGQFVRAASEALLQAVQQQQEAEAARFLAEETEAGNSPGRREARPGPPPGPGERVLVIRGRASGTRPGPADTNVLTYRRFPAPAALPSLLPFDTLAQRISNRVLLRWMNNEPFDLRGVDSLYRRELGRRGIGTDFRLDTLVLAAGAGEAPVAADPRFPVRLNPLPVNPMRNLFLRAAFGSPAPYLLRKIAPVLAGSVLLGVLTTGCFLYMLSTILRQKKLSEIKNDFVSNMTHELKTPLATVSAAVEAMQSFGVLNDPHKTQLYLGVSRRELQRLADLVDKVLHVAVAEKKEMELLPEPVDAAELIREIVALHQLKTAKPVAFQVEAAGPSQWVRVDKLHVANAIHNLVDNAINYSGDTVRVRISSRVAGTGWRLSVGDNGPGIPAAYRKAVFERFFRIPTGDLHPVKGFGLGLSYVKDVVEKHGGRVEVGGGPGGGSEFVLWFPRAGVPN